MNKLIIGGREFSSRLFVGTGKFSSNELMEKAIEASGSEMITVAMKRINMTQEATDDMLTHIDRNRVQFLPNTSGVRNAEEAVLAAQFSRECFGTDFVKLEIQISPTRSCGNLESYRTTGKTGIRGTSLYSSRPRTL